MNLFLQLFALGCATGGIYAISAMGVVAVFRSSGVINFAHGAVAMAGGYVMYSVADTLGLSHLIAVPAGILVSAVLGWLVYAVVIRPLADTSTLTRVIATLGVFVVLQQGVVLTYGSALKIPHPYLPTGAVRAGPVSVGADQLILFVFSAALTAVLWAVFKHTRFGLATSAVAESPRSLAALAWRVGRLRGLNWALGGALAGVAGIALAPSLQLQPNSFALLIIPTLASAMLGGLRSFPLTLLGGITLGVLQAVCAHYLDLPGVGDAVPFLVIIAVLMLMGRTLPLRSHLNERLPRVGSGKVHPVRLLVAVAVVAVAAQTLLGVQLLDGLTVTLVTSIILLSQVVVTGYAGQLSLAQVPIAGVGAIIAGRLLAATGLPFPLAIVAGGLAAIPVALAVGLPALRARGVSLAIATLGFGVAINAVILRNSDLNGGAGGLQVGFQSVFGIDVDSIVYPARYAILCGLVFVLLALVVANVRRGRVGRRMLAVRTNERAAAALGVDVASTKLYAFVLAGVVAGIGGVLGAFRNPTLTFTSYDPLTSVNGLIQSVIGGIGYVPGALLGGVGQNGGLATAVANTWLFDIAQYLVLILGIGLIVQVIVQPNGIADVIAHPKRKKGPRSAAPRARLPRPFARRRAAAVDAQIAAARRTDHHPSGGRLEARGVTVRFGSVVAVDDLSFEIRPGEVVAVIGPNGAGKTTLMDALSGFVPATGTVLLDGSPLSGLPAFRRTRAGLTRSFQSLELLEDMTVLDNLRCASDPTDAASYLIDLVRPDRGRITVATVAAIDTFTLAEHLHRFPTELAYGTRHLVAIARAVAAAPKVLMLDEPAAGLSEVERTEVGDLIRHLADDWGIAVLLVEHDVELVRRVSDRAIALDFGRQIAAGTPDEVLADPRVVEAYLGHSTSVMRPTKEVS
ncbi:branched-chain amino acid ABC transporter permease/ATP-binding protein [Actinoallomurus spadix]|uniref:Branched-chain amino acid ABC transporter permease/ATP-binding protein n=1 Tax=Actinoallomurus spadix TaxID=79912 RepID=A0ABN0XJA1_9ACTN|nr:branched-chain amino acid ABC transporter permease/ATP-binding protein [Actinoallomurus spadix]MCO5984930.1 branched-chain amino acid ABC transporter permease/ATP-binding protein [Actinoallomurus spadix]